MWTDGRTRAKGDDVSAMAAQNQCEAPGAIISSNPPHKASKVQPCITHKWREQAAEGLLAPPPSRSRAVSCSRPEGREVKAGWGRVEVQVKEVKEVKETRRRGGLTAVTQLDRSLRHGTAHLQGFALNTAN